MRPEVRQWAQRAVKDVPPLTDEQIRKLSLVIGPVLRKQREGGQHEAA